MNDADERTTADGTPVLVERRPGSGLVAVSVTVPVGFRHELPGQEGLAHLCEHLMGHGAPHHRPHELKRTVTAAGGRYVAFTRHDHTTYVTVVPTPLLPTVLTMEQERLRALGFDDVVLERELGVVAQEIREARDAPGGTWPHFALDAALFRDHALAHDGYGDVDALARLSVDDVAGFAASHHRPSRCAMAVVGDVGVRTPAGLDGPSGPPVEPPSRNWEPAPYWDDTATRDAVEPAALAWVGTDPTASRRDAVAELLVTRARAVELADVPGRETAHVGSLGDWWGTRAPVVHAIDVRGRHATANDHLDAPPSDHAVAIARRTTRLEVAADLDELARHAVRRTTGRVLHADWYWIDRVATDLADVTTDEIVTASERLGTPVRVVGP